MIGAFISNKYKSKFKRWQLVTVLKEYYSRPKMSLEVRIQPGDVLKVDRIVRRDNFIDKDFVIVKSDLSSFKLPIDEEVLVGWTKIDKLLYWSPVNDPYARWE